MTTSQFGTALGLPSPQGSGPWGNLRTPYPTPPSSFTTRQNLISGISRSQTDGFLQRRGSEGGVPQTYQQINMAHGSREVSMVIQDNNFSRGGYRGNGRSPSPSQLPSSQIASQESLDLSGSGQFEREAAGESQDKEDLRTPNPQTSGAPPPNSLEDVQIPVDLSQKRNAPLVSDDLSDIHAPTAVEVDEMKRDLGDLQEKLERSRDDYDRRVFQSDRYTREETTALLKAIAWKAQVQMKMDDLPLRDLPVRMKSRLYWDSDFRGQGSLLAKFREYLGGGIRNRDGGSLKRKWNRIFKDIAWAPVEFFKENGSMAEEMEDQDKIFLVILAKEWCLMKGVGISDQKPVGPTAAPPPSPSSSVPMPTGNPFWNEDPFKNSQGRDDMPVFLSGFPNY